MLGKEEEERLQFNTDDDLFYEATSNTPRCPDRLRKRGEQSEALLDKAVIGARLRKTK